VVGFVASGPGFNGQAMAWSTGRLGFWLADVFGDRRRACALAVGVAELPLDAPVEVELVVEVG